jgi:hypothetical protein
LVIRTENIAVLKEMYEQLGLEFTYHRHGNGPFHYSSEMNGLVFEIYPSRNLRDLQPEAVRLGFEVDDLSELIGKLKNTDWNIIGDLSETEWGITALVQDRDGRKVELKGKNLK